MRQPAQIRTLPDGKRLHLNDGPIDLIVEAFGDQVDVRIAYQAAAARFVTVLDELCSELPLLRAQSCHGRVQPGGVIARRMAHAVVPYAERCFITPMAAVAGAVAEEILSAMTSAARFARAYVNNGGDIAFHLAPGQQFVTGMIERPDHPSLFGTATLGYDQPARGIATSGWRGRSFSLGIADAVTVLASTASQADAAATVIANAVDLPNHPGILREPARNLAPDSDLGNIPVTRFVPALAEPEICHALAAGVRVAQELSHIGLISSAALCLQGEVRVVASGHSHAARQGFRCESQPFPIHRARSSFVGALMPDIRIRRKLILVEEIFHEGGPPSSTPQRRGAALAVIHNPFAGNYFEHIEGFMEDLKPLGLSMAKDLVAALGGNPRIVEGYGKGAIVGTAGELEHGALWHVPGGYAMRDLLGGAKAIVPSTKKVGALGTRLDVPVTHINASYVRSHFDSIEVGIPDAPRADEIVLALVMTTGPRIHARVGGLKASEIKGEDGLR